MELGVRTFTLRELDEQITVGPERSGLTGNIRLVSESVSQVFSFLRGNTLSTDGQVYSGGPDRRNDQFEVPTDVLAIPGIRVFYNVGAGWLNVQRSDIRGSSIEITVDFPGDKPLKPLELSTPQSRRRRY